MHDASRPAKQALRAPHLGRVSVGVDGDEAVVVETLLLPLGLVHHRTQGAQDVGVVGGLVLHSDGRDEDLLAERRRWLGLERGAATEAMDEKTRRFGRKNPPATAPRNP